MYSDVQFLRELWPFRNYQQLGILSKVVDYIKDTFEKASWTIKEQKWIPTENEYTNVIGVNNDHKTKKLGKTFATALFQQWPFLDKLYLFLYLLSIFRDF